MGMRMGHEPREIRGLCQRHSGMVERLSLQPMVITHHPIPRVPHQRKGEILRHLLARDQSFDIGQPRMLPQPS